MQPAGRADRRPLGRRDLRLARQPQGALVETLFARATDGDAEFRTVLDKFYDGEDGPAISSCSANVDQAGHAQPEDVQRGAMISQER